MMMSDSTARTLAGLTYDLLAPHADLGDVAERLSACKEVPRCRVAAAQLRKIRRMIAHVLDNLDSEVQQAQAHVEQLAAAPF